jgi:hypothetical protein
MLGVGHVLSVVHSRLGALAFVNALFGNSGRGTCADASEVKRVIVSVFVDLSGE